MIYTVLNEIFSSGLFMNSHYASPADMMGKDQAPSADVLAESELICSMITNLQGSSLTWVHYHSGESRLSQV